MQCSFWFLKQPCLQTRPVILEMFSLTLGPVLVCERSSTPQETVSLCSEKSHAELFITAPVINLHEKKKRNSNTIWTWKSGQETFRHINTYNHTYIVCAEHLIMHYEGTGVPTVSCFSGGTLCTAGCSEARCSSITVNWPRATVDLA